MSTELRQDAEESNNKQGVTQTMRDIHGGRFTFREDLYVSGNSIYGDSAWSWVDKSNARLNIYSKDRLTLDWLALKAEYDLTEAIVTDVRKFAYMRRFHSAETFPGNRMNENAHPATIVNEVRVLCLFLSHIRKQLSEGGFSLINRLQDILAEDLDNALSAYSRGQMECLKKALTYLASPVFTQLLDHGPLKWTAEDVKTLGWSIKRREPYKRLPDDLFRLLSNSATADVKQFLCAVGMEPQDKTKIGEGGNIFLESLGSFRELFEEYLKARINLRSASDKNEGRKQHMCWLKSHSNTTELSKLVDRARTAAQAVIAMYTGARLSELNNFKVGCLSLETDGWVIFGTVVKDIDLNAPEGQDKWVAIPIVRDAVTVLEVVARLIRTNYLFHGKYELLRVTGRMESNSFIIRLKKYVKLLGSSAAVRGLKIHSHMFRHTLVFQMRRAGLNLPFITFQLKHKYDALQRSISDTTIGYGGLESESTRRAIEEANLEVVRQVYHPDAPVAGGGAEQHKARRAAFFKGMAVGDVDHVLRQLAKKDLPLTDVGPGLCQGQRVVVIDGVKSDPPCIGGLRCNTVRCQHGIIPEYKLPWWERIATDNRTRAADPEFAHAKAFYLEAADEADAVVEFLERERRRRAADEIRNGKGPIRR